MDLCHRPHQPLSNRGQRRSSVSSDESHGTFGNLSSILRRPRSTARSLGETSAGEHYADSLNGTRCSVFVHSRPLTRSSDDTYEPSLSAARTVFSSDEDSDSSGDEAAARLAPSSPLHTRAPGGLRLRDPIRSKRHHTVDTTIDKRIGLTGPERKLRWAPQEVLISSIQKDNKGLEFVEICGETWVIADRKASFTNSSGQIACEVSFPDSWVPDEAMDQPEYLAPGTSQVFDAEDRGLIHPDRVLEPDEDVRITQEMPSSPPVPLAQQQITPFRRASGVSPADRHPAKRPGPAAPVTHTRSPDGRANQDGDEDAQDLPSSPPIPLMQEPAASSGRSPRMLQLQGRSANHAQVRNHIARSASILSTTSWSALDLGRITSLKEPATSDSADFGPAIKQRLLNDFHTESLRTKAGARRGLLDRLLLLIPRRPVQFTSRAVYTPGHYFNFTRVHNAEAVLVHYTGYDVIEPCGRCAEGRGIFRGCVVGDDFAGGACTNCAYSDMGCMCSFRDPSTFRDPSKPAGASQCVSASLTDFVAGKARTDYMPAIRLPQIESYTVRSLTDGEEEPLASQGDHGVVAGSTSLSAPSSDPPTSTFSNSLATSQTTITSADSNIRASGKSSKKRGKRAIVRNDLPLLTDEVLRDSSDAEETISQHAAKRRRVERRRDGDQDKNIAKAFSGDEPDPGLVRDRTGSRQRDILDSRSRHPGREPRNSAAENGLYYMSGGLSSGSTSPPQSHHSREPGSTPENDAQVEPRSKRRKHKKKRKSGHVTDGASATETTNLRQPSGVGTGTDASQSRPDGLKQPNEPPSNRCKVSPSVASSVPAKVHQQPSLRPVIVYNDARFKPGEMTKAQFVYIKSCCDESNIGYIKNEWAHAMAERPRKARTHQFEYFRSQGVTFFNEDVIPVACRKPVCVELD